MEILHLNLNKVALNQEGQEKAKKSRTLTFKLAKADKNRNGLKVDASKISIENFNANPVIGYQHALWWSTDPDSVIAKGYAYVDDEDELSIDVTFETADINETADKVFQKLLFGSLNSISAGYILNKYDYDEDEDAIIILAAELAEASIVNIPGDSAALVKKNTQDIDSMNIVMLKSKIKTQKLADEMKEEMEAEKKENAIETEETETEKYDDLKLQELELELLKLG